MKCPNCSTENTDSAKFCKKCGNPLDKENTHGKIMDNINNEKKSGSDNSKLIIAALIIVVVVLAGVFVYSTGVFSSNDSSVSQNDNPTKQVDNDDNSDDDDSDTKTASSSSSSSQKTAKSSTSSMKILGGSFSTGSSMSAKTYASIYVGTDHAGQDVTVQIWYSRDGSTLNNGNMVPATVHSDGYLEISSADAYRYYPDHATINLYDTSGNLLDTQSVSLSASSGTQTF